MCDAGIVSNLPSFPIVSSPGSDKDATSALIGLRHGMSLDIERMGIKDGYTHRGLNFSGTAGSLMRMTCCSSISNCGGDALRMESLVMTRGM
jgi:hypothetical protein